MKKATPLFLLLLCVAACVFAQPTISSVSPLVGYPASSVTITGTNFNTTPANNIVYFGATRATVTTASATSLTVTVPTGATYMPVSVNNTASALTGYSQYPFLPTYDNSAYVPGIVNFAGKEDFAAGNGPVSVAIGDIDGDGKPDLAMVNYTSNTVSVYRNTSSSGSISSGSFAAQVTFATGTRPIRIAIGDIDGDGKPDLAVANYSSNTVSVYRNTSSSGSITSGSFAPQVTFAAGANPYSVAIGDIDGDGKADLVVANWGDSTVSVLRNTSSSGSITSGSFATEVDFATVSSPSSVAICDLDGDGKPDLVGADFGDNSVFVLRNTSSSGSITSGSFAAQVTFATGTEPVSVAIGDIDGDGKPDLAVANWDSDKVSVIRNNPVMLPPTITSISPLVGYPASSVTIAGTNFNTTPANNIVFFGATQATVTIASATSLTVTVPTGATYQPVSVNNTASALTGYSQYPFLPTYDDSPFIPGTVNMNGKVDFTAGDQPFSLAIGDLDGDGKADLAVVNAGSSTVSVFRNTSSSGAVTAGSFAAKVDFATGANPFSVAIGDLDGDGKADLAVANVNSNTVSVFRNTSSSGAITSGSFAAKVDFITGTDPYSVAIGDLDGDGKADLAVANANSHTVSVFRNTSSSGTITSGSFAARVNFTTGAGPVSVAIGDLDGDGKADLAVANSLSATVSVFRNTSSSGAITAGSFAASVDFTTGTNPHSVAIGDLDGDGKADLAVVNMSSNTVSVFRNTSSIGAITSGSFAARVDFTTGTVPRFVAIGDLNGDGKADLAVVNRYSYTVSVFRNTSSSGAITSGSFAAGVDFTTGAEPRSVAIGDLDGDGKADLAVANNGSTSVSVIRNSPLLPPPAISAVSPLVGYPASSVTIAGTNFNTTPANNIVYFGATRATVTTASATSLTVTVPTGATYMPVSVNNTALAVTGYSQYPFLPTYDNSAYIPGTVNMNDKVDFTAGTQPFGVAIGDIDGDGKSDLAVVNVSSNTVSVFRNTSSSGAMTAGSFAARVDFATGSVPRSVAIGDLDGDGKADLAVANFGSNAVSVFRNTSSSGAITSGSFAARVSFTTGTNPTSVAIGDLDGDGKADLAVVNYGSATLSVFRNTGSSGAITSGSFAAKVDFTTGTNPWSVAMGDLDGDGKADLAVANGGSATVSVFRNTSSIGAIASGSFAARVDFATGTQPLSVAIGDLDGDGKADLAVVNFGSATVSVFRNTSSIGAITSGSFAARVDFTTGTNPLSVAIGDLDGDGKADLAVANYSSTSVSVFRNTSSSGSISSGSFAAQVTFAVGVNPRSVVIGDIDGDGKPDLAVANVGSNNVSVIRNNPLSPITGTTSVCAAETTTLSNSTSGGTWSSSDAGIASVGSSTGLVTGVTPGTATISYTVTGGSATVVVTVNTLPGAITGALVICQATTTTLGNSVSGGTWSSSNTGVAAIDVSTGAVSGLGAGTAIISYSTGCGTASVATMTIDPIPAAITGTGTICIGGITTFSNSVPGGTWVSGTPSVATVDGGGVVTGLTAGNSDISYVMGCASVKRIVTVNGAPTVPAVAGMSGVCEGASISLTNAVPDGTWSSSNTTVAIVGATGIVTGLSGGTAAISYIVYTSCGTGYSVKIVSVYSLPGPIAGTASVCEGSMTTLSTTPGGGTWSSSTAAASINPTTGVATGNNEGTTIISYQAPTGCYRTIELTVNATPVIIAGSAVVCEGSTTTFTATPSGGTWSSSFPLNATVDVTTGVLTGVATGTTIVSYNLPFGCRATTIVTVNTTPAGITGSLTVCGGSTSALSSATTGGTWSSSDAAVATINASSGVVSGISAGTTTISYTTGSCATAVVVTVSGTMTSSTGTALVCAGQAATLSNATGGGTWSSSNTAAATVHAASGLVTGVGAGTTNITYTLSGGCYSVTEVTVNATMASITGSGTVCAGSTTPLSHADGGGVWSSSNTSRVTIDAGSGIMTGVAGGSATISYVLSAGCVTTRVITVNVLPNTIGGGGAAMCLGGGTTFSCTPSGGTWSSTTTGVATIGSTGVITSVSEGTSVISYTLGTGCASTRTVTVLASPSAITGSATACIGSTTTLSSSPAGGTWTSSVPSKATVVAGTGVVTGVAAGNSTISYTLSTGCRRTIIATVVTLPGAIGGVMTLCSSCTTTLTSATFSGTWTSSNAGVATVNPTTGVVSGVGIGTATISYTVGTGCSRTAVVTVGTTPASITGTHIVCVGQTNATLDHPVPVGTWSSSNTTVATVHAATGIFTGISSGTATISYIISPGYYATTAVTVEPAVATISGNSGICPGATMMLSNTTPSGVWSSNSPLKATVDPGTGLVTAITTGTAAITYTVGIGCYNVAIVTVNTVPNIMGSNTVANGGTTTLIGSPAGGVWASADAGVASVVAGTGVVTGVSLGATSMSYTIGAGCSGVRTITVVVPRPGMSGVAAEGPGVLKVYPNPTSGILTIEAPVAGRFNVYTIDGREVAQYAVTASANMVTLPSNLTAGIYMCRFVGADGTSAIVRLVYEQ